MSCLTVIHDCPSAPSAVPVSETPALADKPAKSKAELKAERRARQEAERASKQGKKTEVGQQAATGKPKAPPSELQPGTVISIYEVSTSSNNLKLFNIHSGRDSHFSYVFSGEEAPRTYPGGQPRGLKETGQEIGKTTG